MSGTKKGPSKPLDFMSDEWYEQTEEDAEAPSLDEIRALQEAQEKDGQV